MATVIIAHNGQEITFKRSTPTGHWDTDATGYALSHDASVLMELGNDGKARSYTGVAPVYYSPA